MKTNLQKVLSLVLCFSLCFSLAMPASAVGENNTLGVTFEAVLDMSELTVSDAEQTVKMTVRADQAVTIDSIGMTVTSADTISLTAVTGGEDVGEFTAANYNLSTGEVSWSTADAENITGVTDLVVATFTVPANTPAGTYMLGAEEIVLSSDYGTSWEDSASVSATLTIKDASTPASGYTAGLTTTTSEVTVGNIATVNVGVSHSEDTYFNAAELVVKYDSDALTLEESSLGDVKYTNENGTLTIEDFGGDKNFATDNYSIQFTGDTVGETIVALGSAAFVRKENADKSDLILATLSPATVTINVKQETYSVTLPTDGNITGDNVATKGEDYTFTANDTDNYDYEITVKVNDAEIDTVTGPDENGQYTIPAASVTGDIVIIYERTGKEYTVTWKGDGAADVVNKEEKAYYGTDFEFSVPTKIEPTAEDAGATYSATVSIVGSGYSTSASAGETVTIPGDEIVGNITITVTKEELPANGVSVSISGADVKFDDGTTSKVVTPGTALNLVLNPEAGYIYSVTIDDQQIMNNTITSYELTVQSATEIKVSKTLDVSTVEVAEYVTIDSVGSAWLVTFKGTLAEGKIPTYDSNNMFWSEKYDAYCYLVIAGTLSADGENGAKTKIGAATVTATNVDYGFDINKTAIEDAADAQLVWNMYNSQYLDFTTGTMAQFLAADQNGSKNLNTDDAVVIINAILNP